MLIYWFAYACVFASGVSTALALLSYQDNQKIFSPAFLFLAIVTGYAGGNILGICPSLTAVLSRLF